MTRALCCLLYVTLGRPDRKPGLPTVGCYATNSRGVVSRSLPTVEESCVCMGVLNLRLPSNDGLQSDTSQYNRELWAINRTDERRWVSAEKCVTRRMWVTPCLTKEIRNSPNNQFSKHCRMCLIGFHKCSQNIYQIDAERWKDF
jgi:hypothetical protein